MAKPYTNSRRDCTAPVSVVVPCYRCSETIDRAIASVAAQTLRPLEVILVDDGSGDGTLNMLQGLRRRYGEDWIRIVQLPANVGVAGARNAGWDAAGGDYIAFLDADDAWHPDKIKIQYEFMATHREFTLTGHGHRQIEQLPTKHSEEAQPRHESISYRALLLSNRFITPSAMIRRDAPFRFHTDKRHMEDFHLWLTVAASGHKIAFLDAALAYIFKAPFGETGLSADILAMEKGELGCYWGLHRAGHLPVLLALALSAYSCVKFLRRIVLASLLGRRAAMPWLFPIVYLTVTHSTTALLIIVGMLGKPGIAADIGLIHGATVATFYALSANTRNLILRRAAPLPTSEILLARLVLVVPLMIASLALAVTGTAVSWWLAACLVVRRGVEWINEVHLCEAELSRRTQFATLFFLLQCTVFVFAAASLAFEMPFARGALILWAVLPLAVSIRFLGSAFGASLRSIRRIFRSLGTHAGSTAIIGLGIYAFRILVVLIATKEIAGDLFTAIAIGSFMGTLFANVLGPSVELHRERTGRASYPAILKLALTGSLLSGVFVIGALKLFPQAFPLLGKPDFFWLSCGLSLVGGALMVVAQDVRLRVLRASDGRDVFGPDVLIHLGLLGAVPLAYFFLGISGLSGLYLANALLAYLFYKSSELGLRWGTSDSSSTSFLALPLSFLLVFPLFFQLSGRIYNSVEPVVDSGGVLTSLPLPVSVVACFTGVLLLARYRLATRSFIFIFLFFAAMLLSTVATTNAGLERGKLLLLIQFLLPAFGLVLGEMIEAGDTDRLSVEKGFFWACALIMPVQLGASWVQGGATLTHYLGVFSVYQHRQYVPVVLVSAALISAAALWTKPRYRPFIAVLVVASLIYAVSAVSLLGIFLALAGVAGLTLIQTRNRRLTLAVSSGAIICFLGYMALLRDTPEFVTKLVLPGTAKKMLSPPCLSEQAQYISNLVHRKDAECLVKGVPHRPFNYLISLPWRNTTPSAVLIVEGEIVSGGVTVGVVQGGNWALRKNFDRPGPFRVEIKPGAGRFEAVLANYLPSSASNEVRIERMGWKEVGPSHPVISGEQAPYLSLPDWAYDVLPTNLRERMEDWALFGKPIFSSYNRLLFGHPPMDRSIRTSAHNYYIDLAYNFGIVSLMPIAALLVYTSILLSRHQWRRGQTDRLLWLALLVAFFILLDSNFKVTLRQPYPGILAFFLWGLLLARLRRFANTPALT